MFGPITLPFGAKMLFNTVKLKPGVTFDDSSDLGYLVCGKAALLGVLANHGFVGCDVYTIDLVIGHVALDPLDRGPKLLQGAAGFCGNLPKLLGGQFPSTCNLALDHILWHDDAPFLGFLKPAGPVAAFPRTCSRCCDVATVEDPRPATPLRLGPIRRHPPIMNHGSM